MERYRRQGEREWLLTELEGMGAVAELSSIDCELPLSGVYEKVLEEDS